MRRSVLGICLALILLALPATADAALHRVFVAGGFDAPVQVTTSPGVRGYYVAEQEGQIIRLRNGHRTVFLDISDLVLFSGEQGFLSIVFSPGYHQNHRFFVYYINTSGDSVVVRYLSNSTFARAVESSRQRLARFDQPGGQDNHKGGTLLFARDGRLLLSLGDGGGGCDPLERAQNPASPLGKLLWIRSSGAVVLALGLRNPYRISVDSATGDVWMGDVGQDDREEVDFLAAGNLSRPAENFEWDVMEGNLSGTCENNGYGPGARIDPVLDYPRSFGGTVIGGYRYRGTDLAGLRGDYFFGDFLSGVVARINGPGDSTPATLPFSVPNLTSFGETQARELLVLSINGSLYRIDDD